jgi:hypothetical protein
VSSIASAQGVSAASANQRHDWGSRMLFAVAVCVCSGCGMSPIPAAHAKKDSVETVAGKSEYRIECIYDAINCERKAREVCHGPYEVVTRGDRTCADCGFALEDGASAPVYRSVLYVRCR